MGHILDGQVLVNGTDIWKTYGVFLTERRRGGMENLKALLSPSAMKGHVGVDIREEPGKKYSKALKVAGKERDLTLHFALYGKTKAEWLRSYASFLRFLKEGKDGWLELRFPGLDLTLRVFYVDSPGFEPVTYLWKEGVQAGRFKVRFREPVPTF